MALPNVTVEIAFDSGYTTAAGSRTWTDVSAYVEGAQSLTINRGRPDEVSQVQPSRLVLMLNNADGRFTPRLSTGAYYPDVKKGRPVRVTVTHNAVDYVRYTGYVSEWPVSWPDSSSAACVVNLTSTSRMARLGRGAELRSIVEEEILADSPAAYYTLGEPEGATSAADSSGNQAPALTMAGDGDDVVFGNATGLGTDGLTAATFAGGKYLVTTLGAAPDAVELWFLTTGNSMSLVSAREPLNYVLTIDASGVIRSGTVGLTAGPTVNDGTWHQLLWSGSEIVIDGVSYSPVNGGPGSTTLTVGDSPSSEGSPAFAGSIAHVSA